MEPSIVGLKALLDGEIIEIGGYKYVLQDGQLYMVAENPTTNEKLLLKGEMSLVEFIYLCNCEKKLSN